MNRIKNNNATEKLNQSELSIVKGGEERDYYYVTIDGKRIKIYI